MLLSECLPELEKELLEEIGQYASIQHFSKNETVVEEGQIVRFLPIVLKGSIKVFSREDAIQFLLYYISSGETCIFSFAHVFKNRPLEFSAAAEVDSKLLLLPIDKVRAWYTTYPRFCNMLLQGYQKHYDDLLHTTKQIICYNLEERLIAYLKMKVQITASDVLEVTHQDIADSLGTSREVISRLMKKLNSNNKVVQLGRKIKVL